MNKLSKILTVTLTSFFMCVAFAACGDKTPSENDKKDPAPEPVICNHTSHDKTNKICPDCKTVVEHHYVNKECTLCDSTTEFMWECIKKDPTLMQGSEQKGSVERITYSTHAYNMEAIQGKDNIIIEKEAYVYLPYNYSAENKYDVLVLLHGSGETAGYWLGEGNYNKTDKMTSYYNTGCFTVDLLDLMIAEGTAKPTIVVTPTFYDDANDKIKENSVVQPLYGKEIVNSLLPKIIETYSTYADSANAEDMIAVRDHFGFAGLSRGSRISFDSVVTDFLPYFAYIGSYSSAATDAANVAKQINENFKDYDIKYWFMACGTYDSPRIEQMHETYDTIVNGTDKLTDLENCALVDIYETHHTYECWITCLYNSMLKFFQI